MTSDYQAVSQQQIEDLAARLRWTEQWGPVEAVCCASDEEDPTLVRLYDDQAEVSLPYSVAVARLALSDRYGTPGDLWALLDEDRYSALTPGQIWEAVVGSQTVQDFLRAVAGEDVSASVAEYLDDLRSGTQGMGVDFAAALTDQEVATLQRGLERAIEEALEYEAERGGWALSRREDLEDLNPGHVTDEIMEASELAVEALSQPPHIVVEEGTRSYEIWLRATSPIRQGRCAFGDGPVPDSLRLVLSSLVSAGDRAGHRGAQGSRPSLSWRPVGTWEDIGPRWHAKLRRPVVGRKIWNVRWAFREIPEFE